MDDADRAKFLLDLFVHPGWKVLIEEMTEAHATLIETAYTVEDERALYRRKGEIQKLAELINCERVFKLQMSENENDVE